MAFDAGLAERIRMQLPASADIGERAMFGGLCFLSRKHMFAGIVGERLMLRIGPQHYDQVLAQSQVRVMDFTGKPMKGYVFVEPPGFAEDEALRTWLGMALDFVGSLPAKSPKPRKTSRAPKQSR